MIYDLCLLRFEIGFCFVHSCKAVPPGGAAFSGRRTRQRSVGACGATWSGRVRVPPCPESARKESKSLAVSRDNFTSIDYFFLFACPCGNDHVSLNAGEMNDQSESYINFRCSLHLAWPTWPTSLFVWCPTATAEVWHWGFNFLSRWRIQAGRMVGQMQTWDPCQRSRWLQRMGRGPGASNWQLSTTDFKL